MTQATEDFDAVVVGAGFAGLYMLHKLRGLGLRCRLFEAGEGVGGAWYWNRYPGARCDSESYFYCYSLLRRDPPGMDLVGEIPGAARDRALSQLRRGSAWAAVGHAVQTAASPAPAYDEASLRWTVETDAGDRVTTRYLVTAIGGLTATAANLPASRGSRISKASGTTPGTGRSRASISRASASA